MNKLVQTMIQYIEDEIRPIIIATGKGDVRFEFVGVSREILKQILNHFLENGGIKVTVNGESQAVPVYLLDDVSNNPDSLSGGYCDDAHLTNVRNCCQYFLALIPPNKMANRSINSSTTVIGVPPLITTEKWSEHKLVSGFIRKALASKGCDSEIFHKCIDSILIDAQGRDDHLNDRAWQWKILEVLFNIGNPNNGKSDEIIAACGLPRTSIDGKSIESALSIIKKIKEKMVSEGLSTFFKLLSESLENIFKDDEEKINSIRVALDALKIHLLAQVDSASKFDLAAKIYYSPYRTCNYTTELPAWWKTLSVDIWTKLLDGETEDPPPEEILNVKLLNSLFNPKRGHPHVVRNVPLFEIGQTSKGTLPEKFIVERGVGRGPLVYVAEIETNNTTQWEDNTPPIHEKNLRYKFSALDTNLKSCAIRLISLENYVPGVVIDAGTAKKISVLKKMRGTGLKWETELTLQGKGMQHNFEVHFSDKVEFEDSIKYFNANSKLLLEERFYSKQNGKNQVVLELEEEGHIELRGILNDTNEKFIICARFQLESVETVGVRSWFEKLITLHCKKSSNLGQHRIDVAWSKIQQLSRWILDDEDSFYPLVMSYDYRETWKNPDWKTFPIMSKYVFSNDIRPREDNFLPPQNLLEHRNVIREILNKDDGLFELANLGEFAENPKIFTEVISYMAAYSDWLAKDRNNALWFDTIVLIRSEVTGPVLSQQPDALILNPLHPIRLGWQFLAQHVLYSSLTKQKYCVAAGVLDPRLTPDCMMLPCWTAGGQVHPEHFISVTNNSDYWAVLWNGKAIDRLGEESVGSFFDEDFGIKLDGVAAGFTASQVERSLKDIATIRSARACLKVNLIDDTSGASSCTEGIIRWATENLGEKDHWMHAGAKALEVYDARNKLQWPSPAVISNITNDLSASVRWFQGNKEGAGTIDLSIINHLGTMSPYLAQQNITSAVGHGTLIRQRIRRQLPTRSGNHFISESRKSPKREQSNHGLSETIEYLSWQLESTCDELDSYVFAPKMMRIRENLIKSRYCAVSSTVVDPSCFFDTDRNVFLWDYDLPGFSHRAGTNNGYYLLATETNDILQAVRTNLREIDSSGDELGLDMIRSILREVSGRGFPSLKRLVVKGASSTGEIGMLVALRVLQNKIANSLFPLTEDKYVNLVIPIDPFMDMIASLKDSLGMSGSRPDILAVSIYYHEQPISLKFTPIEVKHRSGVLIDRERKSALGQASEFSKFLAEMDSLAKVETIWKIAQSSLLTNMIDFGFRTASSLEAIGESKAWAEIHSVVLQAIMSGKVTKEIDHRGRLITIEQYSSKPLDLDNDSFNETLVIKADDAFRITLQDFEILKAIKSSLVNWELLAAAKDVKSPVPVKIIKSDEEKGNESKQDISNHPTHKGSSVIKESVPELKTDNGTNEQVRAVGVRFPVGKEITSPFHDREVYFHPSNTDLTQLNIGIVGDLGTGKTQLTKSLISHITNSENENRGNKPKFLIFDYKGDYIDEDFLDATGGGVIEPSRIPLNLFDLSGRVNLMNPVIDVAGFFNDIIGKIYNVNKPIQQYNLKESIKECYDTFDVSNGVYPTIYNVHDSYKSKLGNKVDSTLSILSELVDRELFEQDPSGLTTFGELFRTVTVIDLKSLGQNDNIKNMIVAIFLNLFYDYMLKIEKKDFVGKDPKLRAIDSMLLVDEANSIMKYNFPVLMKILLEGREFGVGVLLASQYLSHFRNTQQNYKQPLFTWFIHRVNNITTKELEEIGLVDVNTDVIERIKSLGVHKCLYKSLGTNDRGTFIDGYPFFK